MIMVLHGKKGWGQYITNHASFLGSDTGGTGVSHYVANTANFNNSDYTGDWVSLTATSASGLGAAASSAYINVKFLGTLMPLPTNPVIIKLTATSLVNVSVQAYNNNDSVGNAVSVSSLTQRGNDEYLFTPSAFCNSVRVKVASNAGVVLGTSTVSANLYYAFVYDPACFPPLYSTIGTTGITSATITDAYKAYEGDLSTFSTFNVTLGVGGTVYQSIKYLGTASANDAVTIAFSVPSTPLSINLLNSISVVAYKDAIQVGTPIAINNLLSLDLLGLLNTGNTTAVTFKPGAAFNRVDVTVSMALSLLSNFQLNEVMITPTAPTFLGLNYDTVRICTSTVVSLTADAPGTGNEIQWYRSPLLNELPFYAGNSYTTTILGSDTTFYVAKARAGCSTRSQRVPVRVLMKPLPVKPASPDTVICRGVSTALNIMNPLPGNTYNWFNTVTGGSAIQTGTTYATGILNADITVYLQADSSNGCSSKRDTVLVNVLPLPAISFLSPIYACFESTSASFTYSSPQNTPAFYHFAWGTSAVMAGFSADTTDIYIADPIPVTIPNTANPANYSGDLIIKNASNGHQCTSKYPFTIMIVQKPTASVITNFQ